MSANLTFGRELDIMNKQGVNYPYAAKLQEQFGLTVPAGAPKHQVEYLYKYARYAQLQGQVPADQLVEYAAKKADEIFGRFPWLTRKYETVVVQKVEKTNAGKSEKAELPDGTIIFCEKRGKYLMYLGGVIQVRASTVEKVKQIAQKKLNFTAFIE